MNKISKKVVLAMCLLVMGIIGKPGLVYGLEKVPSTIRVGLRSAYAGQSSIAIKNEQLEVGQEVNKRFKSEAVLSSNTGFIIKASQKQYYTIGDTFSTYEDASLALLAYEIKGQSGLVVYSGPSNWRLYFDEDFGGMNFVRKTGKELVVQNGLGIDVILTANNVGGSAFAGQAKGQSFNLTQLSKASYRGWFEFVRSGNTITAANILDYEEYLYGVIPSEMPPSWHMEALKAQAVAARSIAVRQYSKYIKDGYNVCDTTFTQVYKGFSHEKATTNQAVDQTRGIVATYNNKIAETLYFSTSGGYTEDPKYLWGNEVPYLKSVADPYETDPEMKPWTRTITLVDLEQGLKRQNINIGRATGVSINAYTPAGRVNELEVLGTSGSHKITGESIRTFFASSKEGSLRSRMFTIDQGKTEVKPAPIPSSGGFEEIQVYKGGSPKYILGAKGKAEQVGNSLTVKGPSNQTVYEAGSSSNIANPSPGQAQYGDIVISGKGYGHGVGMSQSGAKGMANAGYTYDQIIKFYFQGTELGR